MLAIVGGIAFVGFWVGLRQSPAVAEYTSFSEEAIAQNAVAARTNEELSITPWSSSAERWAPAPGMVADPVTTKDKGAYEAAMDARALARAYEGAPPTIPHPVGQGSARECVVCHQSGAQVGTATAPPIPHQAYTSCSQCHVPQAGPLPAMNPPSFAPLTESDFVGHRQAPAPYQAYLGAPPQQPHTSFMREECGSCHGRQGRPGLQSSHPERQSCQQCHTPSAVVDKRP